MPQYFDLGSGYAGLSRREDRGLATSLLEGLASLRTYLTTVYVWQHTCIMFVVAGSCVALEVALEMALMPGVPGSSAQS